MLTPAQVASSVPGVAPSHASTPPLARAARSRRRHSTLALAPEAAPPRAAMPSLEGPRWAACCKPRPLDSRPRPRTTSSVHARLRPPGCCSESTHRALRPLLHKHTTRLTSPVSEQSPPPRLHRYAPPPQSDLANLALYTMMKVGEGSGRAHLPSPHSLFLSLSILHRSPLTIHYSHQQLTTTLFN